MRGGCSGQVWMEDEQWNRVLDEGWDLGRVKQVGLSEPPHNMSTEAHIHPSISLPVAGASPACGLACACTDATWGSPERGHLQIPCVDFLFLVQSEHSRAQIALQSTERGASVSVQAKQTVRLRDPCQLDAACTCHPVGLLTQTLCGTEMGTL